MSVQKQNGFKHNDYEVFPAAQQLQNDDGTPGRWGGTAAIIRWGVEMRPPVTPKIFYPPTFETEEEAVNYAAMEAARLIDTGRI